MQLKIKRNTWILVYVTFSSEKDLDTRMFAFSAEGQNFTKRNETALTESASDNL